MTVYDIMFCPAHTFSIILFTACILYLYARKNQDYSVNKISFFSHIYDFIIMVFWLQYGILYLTQLYSQHFTNTFGVDWCVLMSFLGINFVIGLPFSIVQKRIKIVVFGICMNFSFFIVQMLLDLNSNISLAIRSLGENLFGKNICFSELINTINTKASIDTSSLNIFSIDGLIKSTLSISLLSLVFSYSLRYIMVKVFVLLAPFAFISLCTDNTSWFFKAWLKNLFSLLFIQIIVSLVLLILFSLDFDDTNLFNKFVYVGGVYALIRANTFVREFIGGVSTNVSQSVKSLIHK